MKLTDVYKSTTATADLYELLQERSSTHSISHQAVPKFSEHLSFVTSKPYRYWYLIHQGAELAGSTYITENNEIGLFLSVQFTQLQSEALRLLISSHQPLPALKSKRVAAFSINTNPQNLQLISSIKEVGGEHVQNTYLLPASAD